MFVFRFIVFVSGGGRGFSFSSSLWNFSGFARVVGLVLIAHGSTCLETMW